MTLKPTSLERIIPDLVPAEAGATGCETLALHVARYEYAAGQTGPGRLLDIACGVGYGTRLLADANPEIREAVGVDISADAIEYATHRYKRAGVKYVQSDAMTFTDPAGFDSIVSLETVEHLECPETFLERTVQLLRPGGVFIASVPTTPSVDANPHHRHDFTEASFRRIGARCGLAETGCFRQVQPYNPIALIRRKELRTQDVRRGLASFYVTHPKHFVRRCWSTFSDGFINKYITIVWKLL